MPGADGKRLCKHRLHSYQMAVSEEPLLSTIQGIDDLEPRELTTVYLRCRREFRELCKRAERVSRGSGGMWVEGNRLAYASVLFMRITVMAKSVRQLLPDCKPREHWDFSSVASLARNLAEAYLWYYWLCEDEIEPDVRQGRFILLYCHDYGSRARMFSDDRVLADDDVVKADLISRFDTNPYLATFNERQRREALRGHKTPFVQDEVLDRMGVGRSEFRSVYRFYSQHTHTGPVAFIRILMEGHDRGSGVETAHEKSYMITAILFATSVLESAIAGHLTLFPEADVRAPFLTDADIVRNVEQNQRRAKGRAKRKTG
jgi:Family of unknown function (DUF5677)